MQLVLQTVFVMTDGVPWKRVSELEKPFNYILTLICFNLNRNDQWKNVFSFILGYYLLVSNGYCKHKSGKAAYSCHRSYVSPHSSCEDYCTSQIACVGYDYHVTGNNECNLYPSERSCPSGFSAIYRNSTGDRMMDLNSTPTTVSMYELIPGKRVGYLCYVKL